MSASRPELRTSLPNRWATATNDDGWFDLGRVLTGSWTLAIWPSDRDPVWERVELGIGGADVEIVLPFEVDSSVATPTVSPLPSVIVRLFSIGQYARRQTELRRIAANARPVDLAASGRRCAP